MATFSVNVSELNRGVALTQGSIERIRGEVAAMMANLRSLQSSWQGGASASFGACADQWQGVQTQVEGSLVSIAAALQNSATNYEQAEAAAARAFMR